MEAYWLLNVKTGGHGLKNGRLFPVNRWPSASLRQSVACAMPDFGHNG